MNPTARSSTAERLGHRIGRGLRAYARGERRMLTWLASKGMPKAGATALLWGIKLLVLGCLLYIAFWLFLLAVFAFAGAWAAKGADWDEPATEWRTGPAGFGQYRGDVRIDIGDPYDED